MENLLIAGWLAFCISLLVNIMSDIGYGFKQILSNILPNIGNAIFHGVLIGSILAIFYYPLKFIGFL